MIMKFIRVAGAAGFVFIVGGCRSVKTAPSVPDGLRESEGVATRSADSSEPESSPGLSVEGRAGSMLTWSAGSDIHVADLRDAISMVLSIVEKSQGVVDKHEENAPHNASLKLSVPAESLARFLEEIEALGNVTFRRVRNEDVTADYSGIHTRLQSRLLERDRLHGLLNQATHVEDILAIEIRLNRVQGEVASMETQARNLEKQIDYAAVELNLRLKGAEPRKVYGPLGLLFHGLSWTGRKLFVIRDEGQSSLPTVSEPLLTPDEPWDPTLEDLSGLSYRVQEGDTLEQICRLFAISVEALRQSNPSLRFRDVIPGERLVMPPAEGP